MIHLIYISSLSTYLLSSRMERGAKSGQPLAIFIADWGGGCLSWSAEFGQLGNISAPGSGEKRTSCTSEAKARFDQIHCS